MIFNSGGRKQRPKGPAIGTCPTRLRPRPRRTRRPRHRWRQSAWPLPPAQTNAAPSCRRQRHTPAAACAPKPLRRRNRKPEPAPAAEVAPEQPKGLDAPIGAKDDLKRISGVGPVLEGKLNALGFFHFWQIARWTRAEVDWVDGYLSFKGRIDRDNWISQAAKLAEDSPARPPA